MVFDETKKQCGCLELNTTGEFWDLSKTGVSELFHSVHKKAEVFAHQFPRVIVWGQLSGCLSSVAFRPVATWA